jgi:hypothetical protein
MSDSVRSGQAAVDGVIIGVGVFVGAVVLIEKILSFCVFGRYCSL